MGTFCCVLGQDTLLSVPLSTQVYKWVPANCWGNLTKLRGVTCDGLASRPGEVEILLAASCYRNRDKLRQLWANLGSKASHTTHGPFCSYADFTSHALYNKKAFHCHIMLKRFILLKIFRRHHTVLVMRICQHIFRWQILSNSWWFLFFSLPICQ